MPTNSVPMEKLTLVGALGDSTVTVQEAFFLLYVFAVIFTLPMLTPVTCPLLSTVATEGLLLVQVMVLDAPPLTVAFSAMD